ncbi:EAP30/Vps36 family-domain-containing protein [Lasiosphaeria miniovina]|uniref:Vacuolar protein-sorting-associated protein 36 n=1 Tax=Lasiosphaeria miniovina TaxID=1954250 RepID=A0AA40DI04_9PEZI|nr:EAP30/Vps36 family-domain-containing protein [Lasiosphaeria miniovina]KAK0702051.1 EAP30/Vps36 family-domain-containing protein [Lasiosphaeria miniovina]
MFLKQIDLTTALRPSYLPDEDLLFVQDNVGLYEGKYKLPNHQIGQVYLTSHRVCYVDKADPRKNSLAIDLKDVERYDYSAGFIKTSAKISLVPKATKRSSLQPWAPGLASNHSRSATSSPVQRTADGAHRSPPVNQPSAGTATWVCTICSFSNPVPSNFDPSTASAHTPLPPCLACGIKPTLTHVLKAAISNATSRSPGGPALLTPLPVRPRPVSGIAGQQQSHGPPTSPRTPDAPQQTPDPDASFQCPRCTFLNHPSLMSCEICGAPLISHDLPADLAHQPRSETESPGPFLQSSPSAVPQGLDNFETVKLSFRGGGDKIFYERLKRSMTQRKWLLQGAPPIPRSARPGDAASSGLGIVGGSGGDSSGGAASEQRVKIAGIAGLEHRGQAMRKNNELVIGSAFEDLEALMASAKQIVELAEKFARQVKSGGNGGEGVENALLLAESASQLGLITTKDIVGTSGSGGGDSLYLSELARNLAEFLTDDGRGVLRRAGGIMSLVDLWAVFNRARGGVELVSPADFEKAANLWEKLELPVRLRTFRSGVKVVQARDRTDDTTIRALLAWLRDLHEFPPDRHVPWDWRVFGRGVTARDAAERFGWSIGVAEEELEMAEDRGVLCREDGIEGLRFWENYIDTGEGKAWRDPAKEERDKIMRALKESGFL